MTRVLHVIECGPLGGAPRVVEMLAREQARTHEVTVVCRPDGYLSCCNLEGDGVRVVRIPMTRSVSPFRDIASLLLLRGIVREFRPDLIHAHSSKAGVLGRLVGALERRPVLFSPHNFAYRAYEGGPTSRALFYGIERVLSRLSRHVHFTCQDERDDAIKRNLASPRQAIVIRNGIELAPLRALPCPRQPLRRIGTYARFCPQKRLDLLVEALEIVHRVFPDVRGVIIGGGEQEDALKADVERRNLADVIAIQPDPGGPEEALPSLDIFVLSSPAETFPLSVMEAMAAGRPVVATAVGGLPEMIDHGRTGLLVESGSASAIADALLGLLNDPNLAHELGANAKLASSSFGAEQMNAQMLDVYTKLFDDSYPGQAARAVA